MGLKRNAIVDAVVTKAESLELDSDESAIFDVHDLELKVVVRFASRQIRVMTVEETREDGR